MLSPLLEELIDALQCLPGVGHKSAQRMALHLLEHNRAGASALAKTLLKSIEEIRHCQRCRAYTEETICSICRNPARDASLLCVVESPADLLAIEQARGYRGYYFVLMGRLSPLDGIGPEQLGIERLVRRVEQAVTEVILATNPTVEGEATAHYIVDVLSGLNRTDLKISRIAHGVPMGGELEMINSNTLCHALADRRLVSV